MLNFIENAKRTESARMPLDEHKFPTGFEDRLLHAGIGIATESGEFLDQLKKNLFYGKELDQVNLKEELGDILWYIAIAFDALETNFEEEMNRVIRKLKARYPEKFTDELAEHRDLENERKELEK